MYENASYRLPISISRVFDQMLLTNGRTFAGYTIIRLLGSGGMGEVYLAQHPRLPRRDALKLLPLDWSADAEYRARFNREADLASTLCWPRQQAHLVAHAGSVGGVPCPLHRHRDEIQAPQSLE
jgi:serine/threonine protein kinase